MGQSLTDNQSIAATTTIENILANKAFAILTQNSLITVAITASVVSAFVTIVIGRQVVVDGQEIPVIVLSLLFLAITRCIFIRIL